jgi:hypothetical protein
MGNNHVVKREVSLVTWNEIREDFAKVNPEFAKIIDSSNPSNSLKFVKAKYYYGDVFVKNGQTLLPNSNGDELVPVTELDSKIQNELSYCNIPLFMSLNKSTEVFFDTGSRAVPVNYFRKGNLPMVFEAANYLLKINTNQHSLASCSAGSRTIIMLPKINDKIKLKKLLQRYNIPVTVQIKDLSDHWKIFKTIARDEKIANPWQSTIIFFGKSWLDAQHGSKDQAIRNHLSRLIWFHANDTINKTRFNGRWEALAATLSSRRLQPKSYIIDQVKHLLAIASGNFPGFKAANHTEEAAPITDIEEAFIEHYTLKEYIPTIMHVCMRGACLHAPRYLYYSLSMPTVSEGSPIKKNTSTIISDLREIKLIIDTLKARADMKELYHSGPFLKNLNIDYFHNNIGGFDDQIKLAENIPLEDDSFLQDKDCYKDSRVFCSTSPFFSGCIRIETPQV